jgi:NAD(P)-dependent dehydrogenase (short-subunit alcohol dehydrogenase family)
MPLRNIGAKVIGTSTSAVSMDPAMQAKYSSYITSKFGLAKFYEILAAEYPEVHVVTFHPGIGMDCP